MAESRNIHAIPAREFVFKGIVPKATCRSSGRERIIAGGILPRNFPPDAGIHP